MIQSLVEEGRTVMLSSHLLDEVERTCDAVAIVDHGRVIRQGPIDELTRGAGTVVQVDCAEPARAAKVIDEAGIAAGTTLTEDLGHRRLDRRLVRHRRVADDHPRRMRAIRPRRTAPQGLG